MDRRFARVRVQEPLEKPPPDFRTVDQTTQKIFTLNAIAAAISREADLDKVFYLALDWILEVTGADAGTVFLRDEETGDLVRVVSRGISNLFLTEQERHSYGIGLASRVIRAESPIVLDNVARSSMISPSSYGDVVKSCVGIPLRSDNKVVGVLNIFSKQVNKFEPADIELLTSIGNQIGVAVAKAKLSSTVTQSREQLQEKMRQLQELLKISATFRANAPLEKVLNAICNAISSALGFRLVELSLLDPTTGMMVPAAFAGFSEEEQQELRSFVRPPSFYERIMHPRFQISNSYFISHKEDFEQTLGMQWAFLPNINDEERGPDEWHQKDALAVPIYDRDGNLTGLVFVDDPIDRKVPSLEKIQVLEMFVQQAGLAVENARLLSDLQKSEAQYRLVTENASDLIFLLNPDGSISFASSSAKAILGYQPDELLGKMFADLISPQSKRITPECLINPSTADELSIRCEIEAIRKDGNSVFLEISCTPVFENGVFRGEQGTARDITEKKRMEREIARRQRQLRRSQKREEQLSGYAAAVIAAQEEERRRIARDLHDDTAQALIALSRRIDSLREDLGDLPEAAQRKIEDLKALTDQTLASVRRFSRDLRPSILDDLGLVPALEWLVSENAKRYKITTRLKIQGEERRLQPEVELALFRIAQEALNNTAKHSQATGAAVELTFGDTWCRLTVSDNGIGFQTPPNISELADRGRMGVMGMYERANLLGGNLYVRTAPGQGTRITVTVPLIESSL